MDKNRLGASVFFSRGGGEAGNTRSFFTAIAFQLTWTSTALKRCILDAVDENRDILKRALAEQWRVLILEPLAIAKEESSQLPCSFVIDVLDECDSGQDVQLILKLLSSANTYILYPTAGFGDKQTRYADSPRFPRYSYNLAPGPRTK